MRWRELHAVVPEAHGQPLQRKVSAAQLPQPPHPPTHPHPLSPAPAQVDKLFGPGNQFVTAAKMVLQNSEAMVAIDMPAGPSEVLVIADAGANHTHVALDLLSQVGPAGRGLRLFW